ncbi:hypothetical protein SAMN04488045_1747 [Thalassococcus halodurans]|uniref:Uncharacterized protein n=1 Tax=Thalassococcus halodurans TaxID=373675 RepID=A0A1H5X710_9RHOB|nr:hypothetical protein [Thalassococcus halodurans]SEG07544.1 hypothetical protein SAMN04488045_1747 [Thalassococcus halodurans]
MSANRATFWGAVIAAIISALALIFQQELRAAFVETEEERRAEAPGDVSPNSPSLSISKVWVPPKATTLNSALFAEFSNVSGSAAEDVRVTLDFGPSRLVGCDFGEEVPGDIEAVEGSSSASITVAKLRKGEHFTAYCLMDTPRFRIITITAANSEPRRLTFSDIGTPEAMTWSRLLSNIAMTAVVAAAIGLGFLIVFLVIVFVNRRLDP